MKHIFVSNIVLKKAKDGKWFASKIFTSEGDFDLGQEVSEVLEQSKLENIVDDIKANVLPQLECFVRNEVKEEGKRKQNG